MLIRLLLSSLHFSSLHFFSSSHSVFVSHILVIRRLLSIIAYITLSCISLHSIPFLLLLFLSFLTYLTTHSHLILSSLISSFPCLIFSFHELNSTTLLVKAFFFCESAVQLHTTCNVRRTQHVTCYDAFS